MTHVPVALLNLQDGAQVARGRYDFGRLRRAFATVRDAPAVVQFCEAKHYRDHAGEAKYAAAEALSDQFGVPYAVELGSMTRGPLPPAIFYDPTRLVLRRWWQQDDPGAFHDQRNVATFAVRDNVTTGEQRREFLVWVHHFEPLSGDARLEEAKRVSRYGDAQPLPVLGGGDLNSSGSGRHFPQRDWMAATFSSRSHKGIRDPQGRWGPDTRAIDYLIGEWDETTHQRTGGCGYHAVAEMAWRLDPDKPILPTVNDGVDAGGGLLIDWLLVNDAMRPHVLPETYRVHLPAPGCPPPSDHRLVTMTLDL